MYADPLDRAQATEAEANERNIAAIRNRSQTRELHPNGTCHFCEEPVSGEKLFCDSDCADDHQRLNRR